MYDVKKQYRCDIIRGKAQSQLEDMLPAYAKVISDICPIEKEKFEKAFNNNLIQYLPSSSREKKTLDNHRTEIAGKLFGMYVNSSDGKVYCSERTRKFLEDGDIPAFFKDICYKMQFPNVMQKINTVSQRLQDGISIRSNCYVIKALEESEKRKINLTKRDIGVYILNSLDVLQRKASVSEVLDCIEKDKKADIYREIEGEEADSKKYQHINEQLNYLELANLIYIDGKKIVHLNHKEQKTIELFSQGWNGELLFKLDKSDVLDSDHFKDLQFRWNEYYGKLSDVANSFETKIDSLSIENTINTSYKIFGNTVELGDEGENFVFNYEKKRVAKYNPRLTNKVILFGKQKGLGYDIQSVMAIDNNDIEEYAEMGKYIEVKATRRVTPPNIQDSEWYDSVNITRNEWIAATEKKDFYFIYRVFFTRNGAFIYTMQNPYQKKMDKQISVIPLTYRIEIDKNSIDDVIDIKLKSEVTK
ncbi:MAG: protein NO VEIN domain-containing protein [Treponema sp.]